MFVTKRDGRREPVHFDKITRRLEQLSEDLGVEVVSIAQRIIGGIYNQVTTAELDALAADTAVQLTTTHPDYGALAARIFVSNLHKTTRGIFSSITRQLHAAGLVSAEYAAFVAQHDARLDRVAQYDRDYGYDYFGLKTLERSYLLRVDGAIVERPQDLLLRVACGIHTGDLAAALETYELLSERWFIHATPTLFNAGCPTPQLSSCFLLTMKEDSIEGIFDTLKQCALISKNAGGIGLSISKVRATGSRIAGTNGTSNGIVPMLRVFNNTSRYVDQGGGKRKGAFAVYLEPWHADVLDFLDLRKNTGTDEVRARDLFLGLWIPDLFMRRVEQDGEWSLFCPHEAPDLDEHWGADFDRLYTQYEQTPGLARRTLKARELWDAILEAQVETGTPYILYKDSCNAKSNQQNLGTIKGSNLCTEIIEYTAPDESAVCNLGSLALPKFVRDGAFDFAALCRVCKVLVRNLDRIIDVNAYPTPECRASNLRHRPIGVGVQGLADVFALLDLPYASDGARRLNREIFETIYFAACTMSMELARERGAYESFVGSPMSRGEFQFNLWGEKDPQGRWDWAALRAQILQHGVRNSLLVAPMPTASTSQILGNNECFEPFTSNIYVRRTLAGEFTVINKHLVAKLQDLGLWSVELKDAIVRGQGSIQHLTEIPAAVREVFRTCWEIKSRSVVDLALDRGRFIDQSQSMNVCLQDPDFEKLTALHFYTWRGGLKTGMYYLRSRAAADALQFTTGAVCSRTDKSCTSCSG